MRFLIAFLCMFAAGAALAQGDLEDAGDVEGSGWGGDAQKACTVLSLATNGLDKVGAFNTATAKQKAGQDAYLEAWGGILYDAQQESGVSVDAIDANTLAETMIAFESGADPVTEDASGEESGFSAFDIARTTMSVAAIADPTGVVGVAAAYTYPKCGTEDARNSSAGFCWKNSEVRDAGDWVGDLGRVADCPSGYTNNGLTCGRGADSYAWPSRVADCPSGYTNNGLTCGRGADSYSWPSRVADCPSGYTNNGLFCGRGADSYSAPSRVADCPSGMTNMGLTCYKFPFDSRGLNSMSCKRGEWFQAGRCYKTCRAGYRNMGEFCLRAASTRGLDSMTCKPGEWFQAGRCYKDCKPGYRNMGESCYRGPDTKGLSAMSCGPGEWFQAGRCYKDCKDGYTNMGESCYRGPSTLGISAMTCNRGGEFKQGPRCFDNDVCAPGKELDGLLCYDKCWSGMKGIGPVCWSSCEAPYGVACAAGCATSEAECGLATTDMVASPFEMIGSIATLGGYSGVKSSRKAATLAAREAGKQIVKQGTKTAAQKAAAKGARKLNDLMQETAKAANSEGAEAAAKLLRKGMIEGAENAAKRAEHIASYVKLNAGKAKNAVKTKVFDPVKAKATAADKALRSKSDIIARLRTAQDKVAKNRELAYLKAAHGCTKFGLNVADVATE